MYKEIDAMKLYRGDDLEINEHIKLHIPTLNEVVDIGEKEYFQTVHSLCAVGADLKFQLHDMGIDYTQIGDFEVFALLLPSCDKRIIDLLFCERINNLKIYKSYDENLKEDILEQPLYEIETGKVNKVGNLELFKQMREQAKNTIKITRFHYESIVNALRMIHGLKRNDEVPGNNVTKKLFIEMAREEYESQKDKEFESMLLPLISAMVNSQGFKRNETEVFDMNIFAFLDSVRRIQKIMNASLLYQSGYSGFGVNLKEVNKEDLNWMGKL